MIDANRAAYLSLLREVEDLYYAEADLLDERHYAAWLDLFTDDIFYWMPMRKNVPWEARDQDTTSEDDIAWIEDDKATLTKRVRQLETGIHWAEEPLSRVSHLITNIRIVDPVHELREGEAMRVKCRFFVYRNRLETETDTLVGRREDTLRRDGGTLKIARRKILIEQSVLLAKNLTVFL
ncbi:MAG TPA: 3-phenylpropionate/cinnamic acid dioxygenase subunit beta [Stellaceae bacterium]|nr:3-phenylpropionate/cinnamic acid dioxygenase subunit beta [Stellaceae bacterium]